MRNPLSSLSRVALQLGCLAAAGSFGLANALWFPWPAVLAAAAVAARLRKRPPSDAFGSARWANAADILGANLLSSRTGLPIGYADAVERPGLGQALRCLFNPAVQADPAVRLFLASLGRRGQFAGQPLRWQGPHSAIFAAPGAGKSTAFIIPALLLCPDQSAFVLDVKGEIAKATARFRANFGPVYIIDAYRILGGKTHNYNPLFDIDPDSVMAPQELMDLANGIVFRSGKENDNYWLDQAELVCLAGMAFAVTHGCRDQRNLLQVQEIIADSEARAAAIEAMTQSDIWGGTLRRLGHQLSQLKDREAGSVYSAALRQLSFLHSPPIAECLRQSTFDLGELVRNNHATVYFVVPPDRIQEPQASFVRLILASVIRQIFRAGTSNSRTVRMFIDEAAAVGRMTCIDQALAAGRGYGMALTLAYQSMGQLLTCFPEGQHQTLLSCLGCQIFLGAPNDYQTAEYMQNLIGDETRTLTSTQTSQSRSWSDGTYHEQRSLSRSVTSSETGRKLLQAAEAFHQLSPRQAIIFLPGLCRPIRSTMPRHFEDRSLFAGPLRRFAGHLKFFILSLLFLALNAFLLLALIAAWQQRQAQPPPVNNDPRFFQPAPAPARPQPPVIFPP